MRGVTGPSPRKLRRHVQDMAVKFFPGCISLPGCELAEKRDRNKFHHAQVCTEYSCFPTVALSLPRVVSPPRL